VSHVTSSRTMIARASRSRHGGLAASVLMLAAASIALAQDIDPREARARFILERIEEGKVVMRALAGTRDAQAAVAEHWLQHAELPADNAALGMPADVMVGPAAMNVVGGAIVLRFDADFEARTLALLPWVSEDSTSLRWTCGLAPPRPGATRLVDADPAELTTITVLPDPCRGGDGPAR
jgi:hypothetical protein